MAHPAVNEQITVMNKNGNERSTTAIRYPRSNTIPQIAWTAAAKQNQLTAASGQPGSYPVGGGL